MAYKSAISVKVGNEVVFVTNNDPRHELTVADLINACHEYNIPVGNGTLQRNGVTVSNSDTIEEGQHFTLDFGKGKDGQAC